MTVSTVNSETVLKTVSDAVTLFAFTVVERVFKALVTVFALAVVKKGKTVSDAVTPFRFTVFKTVFELTVYRYRHFAILYNHCTTFHYWRKTS